MCILLEVARVLILYSRVVLLLQYYEQQQQYGLHVRVLLQKGLVRMDTQLRLVGMHTVQCTRAYVYSREYTYHRLCVRARTPRMHTLCILLYTEQYQSMHMHTYCSLWIHVNVYTTCTPRTRVRSMHTSQSILYIYNIRARTLCEKLVQYVCLFVNRPPGSRLLCLKAYNTYAYIASMLVLYGYQLELVLVYDSQYAYESYYPSTSS